MTDTELRAMAALAIMGFMRTPKAGVEGAGRDGGSEARVPLPDASKWTGGMVSSMNAPGTRSGKSAAPAGGRSSTARR
jgi:hypothetical protein